MCGGRGVGGIGTLQPGLSRFLAHFCAAVKPGVWPHVCPTLLLKKGDAPLQNKNNVHLSNIKGIK